MGTQSEKVEVLYTVNDVASGVLKGIRGSFLELNAAISVAKQVWSAFSGVIGDATEAASDSEQVYTRLIAAVQKHGRQWEKSGVSIREFTASMQRSIGVSDELAAVGMQKLIDAGVSVEQSMQAVKTAFDFAAGSGMDAETVFGMLQKAARGSSIMFQRWGYDIDQSRSGAEQLREVLMRLNDDFGGRAIADMNLYAGAERSVKQAWDEILEAGGKIITQNETIKAGMKSVANTMNDLAETQESTITWWEKLNIAAFSAIGWTSAYLPFIARVAERDKAAAEEKAKLEAATVGVTGKTIEQIEAERQLAEELARHQRLYASYVISIDRVSDAYDKWISRTKRLEKAQFDSLKTISGSDRYLKFAGLLPTKVDETNVGNFGAAKAIKNDPLYKQMQDMKEFWKSTTESMKAATASFVGSVSDGFADMVMGARVDFATMAKDFIKMFISAAMRALLNFVALAVFKLKLFDHYENDMGVYQSGLDYAKFLTAGINDGMRRNWNGFAPQAQSVAGQHAGNGGQTNVNVYLNSTNPLILERKIAPILETAINRGRSKLVRQSGFVTGQIIGEVI